MKFRKTGFIRTALAALMVAGNDAVSATDVGTNESADSSCSASASQDTTDGSSADKSSKPVRHRKSKTASAEGESADGAQTQKPAKHRKSKTASAEGESADGAQTEKPAKHRRSKTASAENGSADNGETSAAK